MAAIRGEGSIYQRKSDGMWVCAIDLGTGPDGKRRRKTVTAATKTALVKKRRQLIRDIEDGIVVTHAGMTVGAWLDVWHADICKTRVRPRVWADYGYAIERHLKPNLGKARLDKLTPPMIRDLHKAIAATPKRVGRGTSKTETVSARTVEVCHNILSAALKDAVREKLLRENPCLLVDKPSVKSRVREPITVEQAKALLLTSKGDPLAAMWATALLTGARKSELLGLTWDRVDLDAGTVNFAWQLQQVPWRHGCGTRRDGVWPCRKQAARACPRKVRDVTPDFEFQPVYEGLCFTRPKTSASIRMVPIPQLLVQALRAHQEASKPNRWGLVWAQPSGLPVKHRDAVEAWHAACDRADIPRCDLHATRHTTASLLMELGVPAEVIAAILGHATILSTKGYLHTSNPMAQQALAQLGSALT
jgi:integrase